MRFSLTNGFFLMVCMLFLFIPVTDAQAAPELRVKATAGIDGKTKEEKGAPIFIEVENTGSPFRGDLVIDLMRSHESGIGEVYSMDLDTGEKKVVQLNVPTYYDMAMYGNPNQSAIHFYEGGYEKGKPLKFIGSRQPRSNVYSMDTPFIMFFTNQSDRLAALKKATQQWQITPLYIDATDVDLPTQPVGWEAVDVIVLDEFPLVDLSQEVQKSLVEWVKQGGSLIVGNSDQLLHEVGMFADLLPFTLGEEKTLSVKELNKIAKTERFQRPISFQQATMNEQANPLMNTISGPIVASKSLGEGQIIQTAFSIGDTHFSSSEGATDWWKQLFLKANLHKNLYNPNMYNYFNLSSTIRYSVADVNELFPSFKISIPVIASILLLYIIIIPIIYFILKKKEKREHAWWIVPIIAIVSSIILFAIGGKERLGKAHLNQVATLTVDEDQSLRGYYVESILTNRTGDFTFSISPSTSVNVFPNNMNLAMQGNEMSFSKAAIVKHQATEKSLTLRDQSYWGVSSFYGETYLEPLGQLKTDLVFKSGELSGTITNEFPFNMKDVSIWSSGKMIPIGDLAPGETIEVAKELKQSFLLPARWTLLNVGSSSTGGTNKKFNDDIDQLRKESLVGLTGEFLLHPEKPILIGYTDTSILPIAYQTGNFDLSAITYISQPFEAEIQLAGPVKITTDMMNPFVHSNTGYEAMHVNEKQYNYFFEEQEYITTWTIEKQILEKKINWEELVIKKLHSPKYDVEILNIQTNEFEPINIHQDVTIDNVKNYVSNDGDIQLKLIFEDSHRGIETIIPKVELRGEVVK